MVTTPGMVRSPAMHEGFRSEEWPVPHRHTPDNKVIYIELLHF